MKKKTKAKLYARIINGKVVTGYNKRLLDNMVFTSRLSNNLNKTK